MSRKSSYLLIIVAFVICPAHKWAGGEVVDPDLIRQAWLVHVMNHQNVYVDYVSTTELTPPSTQPVKPAGIDAPAAVPLHGRLIAKGVFSRLDAVNVLYSEQLTDETVEVLRARKLAAPVAEEVVYCANVAVRTSRSLAGALTVTLFEKLPLPPSSKIDIALGLRLHGELSWVTSEDIKNAEIRGTGDGETVHASISGRDGTVHRFLLSNVDNFKILRYELLHNDKVRIEMTCKDWRADIGNGQVPTKVVSRSFYYPVDGSQQVSRTVSISILSGKIDANKLTDFRIRVLYSDDGSASENAETRVRDWHTETTRHVGESNRRRKLRRQGDLLYEKEAAMGGVAGAERIAHSFLLINTGNVPIRIQSIIPECGCTLVEAAPQALLPDESVTISVVLDTTTLRGEFTKRIAVTFDRPDVAHVFLTMSGTVGSD